MTIHSFLVRKRRPDGSSVDTGIGKWQAETRTQPIWNGPATGRFLQDLAAGICPARHHRHGAFALHLPRRIMWAGKHDFLSDGAGWVSRRFRRAPLSDGNASNSTYWKERSQSGGPPPIFDWTSVPGLSADAGPGRPSSTGRPSCFATSFSLNRDAPVTSPGHFSIHIRSGGAGGRLAHRRRCSTIHCQMVHLELVFDHRPSDPHAGGSQPRHEAVLSPFWPGTPNAHSGRSISLAGPTMRA